MFSLVQSIRIRRAGFQSDRKIILASTAATVETNDSAFMFYIAACVGCTKLLLK